MKKLLLITGLICICATPFYAQLKLNLSETSPKPLKYLQMGHAGPQGKEIRINNLYMEEGGIPQLPVMGEFHYSRMDHRYWRDALLKMKSSGINIVATYCLWSLHEELEGEISWSGNLNLKYFVELCTELGLKVHLRIGPYCNAEIKNGGLPNWIVDNKNFTPRSNDPLYLEYVRRWYQSLYAQVGDLLYKNGGPIMAIQLENEYVRQGMVISHLLNLKKIAMESGFDVPLYSMTHWMDSNYPKGEIVPYAGYYIETPWTATGKDELPISNFEYFTYNRISNNIGTDIIKIEGEVESLDGAENDSPYFTCEVGVGTTSFYHRRPIIPQKMAGENINLRLGCGVNLMGYYMYVGGSNPIGKLSTYQSSGPRISYDYQAPIREFGTLGTIMPEVKKYNYFMNDFGSVLAPAIAYLPTSNQNTDNLQWAVRTDGESGFIFCSNYLYKHDRKDYHNIQFSVRLKKEVIKLPRKKVTIENGTYFHWPINQKLGNILLKYSTTQPVCSLKEPNGETFFFFEDDHIPGEYLIDTMGIKEVKVNSGNCRKEKNAFFINELKPGKECVIQIVKENGSVVRLVTLNEELSDQLWKGKIKNREFVALTTSALVYDHNQITLIDEKSSAYVWIYEQGLFSKKTFNASSDHIQADVRQLAPMSKAYCIRPSVGDKLQRQFELKTFSTVERAYLRYSSFSPVVSRLNGKEVQATLMENYYRAEISSFIQNGQNQIEFILQQPDKGIIAEFEILLKNGRRLVWNTDGTWSNQNKSIPATLIKGSEVPDKFAPEEHLALYEIDVESPSISEEETRMYISYKGNIANAYLNGKLIADSFYDGTDWLLGISRLLDRNVLAPLIIRIEGLKSPDEKIYFEKKIVPADCMQPSISSVNVKKEHRFSFKL